MIFKLAINKNNRKSCNVQPWVGGGVMNLYRVCKIYKLLDLKKLCEL